MEVRQAVLQYIEEHGVGKTPWVVPAGTAAQLDSMAALVEHEMFGDEEKLVKTLRIVRESLLSLYHEVEHREVACMLECECMRGKAHHQWASFTAGCFTQDSENGTRFGGRLWDVAEFLRQHSGYELPREKAGVVIGALKSLARAFDLKEKALLKAVTGRVPVVAGTVDCGTF